MRPVTALAPLLAVVVVVAAFSTFTHTAPPVAVRGDVKSECADGDLVQKEPDPIDDLPFGYTGGVTFWCGTVSSDPALEVTDGPVELTPSFSFHVDSEYEFLFIYPDTETLDTSDDCDTLSEIEITSGDEVEIPSGDWNYCAQVVGADGDQESFDVSWSL